MIAVSERAKQSAARKRRAAFQLYRTALKFYMKNGPSMDYTDWERFRRVLDRFAFEWGFQ